MASFRLLLWVGVFQMIAAKGTKPTVKCVPEMMRVTVPMDGNRKLAYLDQMKEYTPCSPKLDGGAATFDLDLADYHRCGVTRVINSITEKRVFYHKIVIEDADGSRETVTVRCVQIPEHVRQHAIEHAHERAHEHAHDHAHDHAHENGQEHGVSSQLEEPHAIAKRAVELPAGFQEPELLEITTDCTERAPMPILGVEVKQNGQKISGEVSVSPGAPLSMEIFLDNASAPVYGLMLGYMQVADTFNNKETIIFNGCSVDPYLFENFVTTDGDRLTAKFRAFKFPDTSYVQFRGTVTVCLDKCQGVQCNNGITGYGRRKREIDSSGDPNRMFEVSLTTLIKVEYLNGDKEPEDVLGLLKNLKVANQMLDPASGHLATVHERTGPEAPGDLPTRAEFISSASHLYVCWPLMTIFLAMWLLN